MVIGCCGSGKSTFSMKLRKKLKLPLIHLDQYYWRPNWTETPKGEWENIVKKLASKEDWIIDGNYGKTLDLRFERADTIIYLDVSTIKCLYRVLKRIWKYHGTERPDMPQGCKERFDFDFLHYVAVFNLMRRRKMLDRLNILKEHKQVVIIKDDVDIHNFLSEIEPVKS